MESNRRMSSAGALAVAIAILAAPGFPVSARSEGAPVSSGAVAQATPTDSTARPTAAPSADTTHAREPIMPVPTELRQNPGAPDTARVQPALPDSATAPAPPKLTPAPAPSPAPSNPPRIRPERRAKPARTRAPEPAAAPGAPINPWAHGTNWVTANFGYAHSGEKGSAPGGYGGGLALRRMLTTRWSLALQGGFDMLGRFDTAKEFEEPFTLNLARHYAWKTSLHPYVETGWGFYRHQYRGTGDDRHVTGNGVFIGGGFESPAGARSVIGAYARYAQVNHKQGPPNPVFDGERTFAVRYSVRLTWSYIF